MTLPREPFSWEGDDDLPVPLGSSTHDGGEAPVSPDVLSEAETLVRVPQQTVPGPVLDGGVTPRDSRTRLMVSIIRPLSPRTLGLLMAGGCALAFVHGWSVGAQAAERPPPKSCVLHHCQVDPPSSRELKGEEFR